MIRYIAKRLGYHAVLLVVAVFLAYALASAALGPRAYFEAKQPRPSAASVDRQLTELNINDRTPVVERFGTWAEGLVFHADLGRTIHDTSVNEDFGRRIWVSLRLLLVGSLLGMVLGVAVGVWGAVRQYRFSDRALTLTSFVLLSTPVFLLALLLKNGAIAAKDAAGHEVIPFTGYETPGLTGGIGAHLADWACTCCCPPSRWPSAAWPSTAATSAPPCSTCSAPTTCGPPRPRPDQRQALLKHGCGPRSSR
ncbi:hypothetical protein GCM10020229_41810 [Kitasatospora albolonga]